MTKRTDNTNNNVPETGKNPYHRYELEYLDWYLKQSRKPKHHRRGKNDNRPTA